MNTDDENQKALKIEIGVNKANFSEIPNSHYKTLEEAFYSVYNLCFVSITKHASLPYLFILLTLRRLMSYIYIYGAPILDVSRSHTTTQHSR